jgi:hypothetical protein
MISGHPAADPGYIDGKLELGGVVGHRDTIAADQRRPSASSCMVDDMSQAFLLESGLT